MTPSIQDETTRPLYGAQTRLAIENFQISGKRMPAELIHALGVVKSTAAKVNAKLGILAEDKSAAIVDAADAVADGQHDDQFPIDVYQTGSGTSTNMNANEVIAELASRHLGRPVHPNDDVNRGQSSNDVIPTAMHVSAALAVQRLLSELRALRSAIEQRANEYADVVKTGRTHLMDAVPITLGQELFGWAAQIGANEERLLGVGERLLRIAQGGTAVGTGLNAHPDFAQQFASTLAERMGLAFRPAPNACAAIAAQDTAAELSGQLRVTAISLLKIATDLRWMTSGPVAGLSEIELPELQPGSSIMPGKVNPVVPEAVSMACTQVVGLDATVSLACQDNRFQLATMLPLIASSLLEQLSLLTRSSRALRTQTIERFTAHSDALAERARRNAMLATALTPRIGYAAAVAIARAAHARRREVIEVAREMTDLSEPELAALLDPLAMTRPSAG